jgi:two-component system, OmpR family, sensor histidine kinase TctE
MKHTWWLAYRLAWRLALVLLVAIGLAALAVGWRAVVTVRALDDTTLQAQVVAVSSALGAAPDGAPQLDLPPALAAAFRSARGSSVFVIADQAGRLLLSSDPAAATLIAPYLPARDGLFRVAISPGYPEGLLGYVHRAGRWRVAVAQSREQSEALVGSLLTEFLSTGVVLLALIGAAAALIGALTVRHGLRPLRLASATAMQVQAARPGLRLPEAGLPGEVAPLVAAVNEALARLEAALRAQRRFVGDAAHTLRTPLAVLTARLDSLPDSQESEALRRDADRMTRLIEQMLQMSRLDGMPLDVSGPVDLHAAAVEAISALAPLALRRGVELALTETAEVLAVTGNYPALMIALTNLIENALAYAPPGTLVDVIIEPPARVSVLDRGPGVRESERSLIFERFGRGHSACSAGAGLGLAIVAGIAAAHRGSVQMTGRDGGGSVFALELGTHA